MLNLKKNYTNKEGVIKEFKYPVMKLIGKDMDDDEQHEFVVLSKDGISEKTFGKYPNYSLFVKYEGEEDAFVLQLSQQAKKAIEKLDLKMWDGLIVTKDTYVDKRTGAVMPCVVAKKETKKYFKAHNDVEDEDTQLEIETEPVVDATSFEVKLIKQCIEADLDIDYVVKNMTKFKESGEDVGEVSKERIEKLMEDLK